MMSNTVAVLAAVALLSAPVKGFSDVKTNGKPSKATAPSSLLAPVQPLPAAAVATSQSDNEVPAETQTGGESATDPVNDSEEFGRVTKESDETRSDLAADLQELLAKFQVEQEIYLNTQKDLKKNLKKASEAEREALREQFQANRERWLETQSKARDEVRERLKELKEELPSKKEVLDRAQEQIDDKRDR
jgi:hypothetical protein